MFQTIRALAATTFWLPEQASTLAPGTDGLFHFIYWICVFFSVLVIVLMVAFVVKYRHREGRVHSPASGHNNTLEVVWTLIPTLLCVMIFFYGFRQFMNMAVEPPNAYEIVATGKMWSWSFMYPNGHSDPNLHVPANTPVRIVLKSDDVIHDLSIPAFRLKRDVVPGRYNRMWFQATKPGTYELYCAQYCGTQHSMMRGEAVVHEAAEFRTWMAAELVKDQDRPPVELGQMIHSRQGCAGCHSLDGQKSTGPTWKDMFGSTVPLADGSSVLADESYIRESVLQPQAKIHAGFGPVMPPQPQLTARDINGLTAFMKSISVNYKGDKSQLNVRSADPSK